MNAFTLFATIVCATTVLLPGLAELSRIHSDRNNPTRLLRVQTRRLQPASPSVSFVGRR